MPISSAPGGISASDREFGHLEIRLHRLPGPGLPVSTAKVWCAACRPLGD